MKLRKIPRGTFGLGGLAAAALCLPLTTLALQALARSAQLGAAAATDAQVLLSAAIFAGIPTFLTGGGVARLVAHRLVESHAPSLAKGLLTGVLAMGIAGAGLTLLAAVPLGGLPEKPARWWPIFAAGVAVGAVTGLAVGLLVAGRTLRHRRRLEAAP
jgi:hypothetical protein